MATFEVTAPDGNTYEVTAPDNATDEQIKAYVQQNYMQQAEPRAKQPVASPEIASQQIASPERSPINNVPGVAVGMLDPFMAATQMIQQARPSVPDSGQTSIGSDMMEAFANVPIAEMLKKYQEGVKGFDYGRLAGNVLSPANIALASKIPASMGLLKSAALAAPVGAGFGLLQPSEKEGKDYWKEKLSQSLLGAAIGPVSQLAIGSIARALSPNVRPGVKELMKEGITPTPGQIIGPKAKAIEERMMSAPILGDMIRKSQTQGLEQLNRSALNRVLKPLGQKLPDSIQVGSDGLAYVHQKASQAYDDILKNSRGVIDAKLSSDISKIRSMANRGLPPENAKLVNNFIDDNIVSRFTTSGKASGETVQSMQEMLRKEAELLSKGGPYERKTAGALKELRASIDNMVERVNPGKLDEIKKAREAWRNYKVMQAATTRGTEAEAGMLTPGQLNAGVYSAAKKMSPTAYQEGGATMQDLSRPAMQILANRVPNSGTPERQMLNWMTGAGLAGGTAAFPQIAPMVAGLGAMTLPYMAPKATASLLAGTRPLPVEITGNLLKHASPLAIPASLGLLNQ